MAKAQAHVPSRRRKIESEKLQQDLSTCQKGPRQRVKQGPAAMAKVRAVGPCALSVPLIHPGVKWLCFQRANSAVRGGMLKVEKWYNEPSRAVSTCQTGLAARANSRARSICAFCATHPSRVNLALLPESTQHGPVWAEKIESEM